MLDYHIFNRLSVLRKGAGARTVRR
jgi:hypothetical protein